MTEYDILSLMQGEWWSIIHKNGIRMAIYLCKGSSKQIVEHNAIIANSLNWREQPVFLWMLLVRLLLLSHREHKAKELLKIQRRVSRVQSSRFRRFWMNATFATTLWTLLKGMQKERSLLQKSSKKLRGKLTRTDKR